LEKVPGFAPFLDFGAVSSAALLLLLFHSCCCSLSLGKEAAQPSRGNSQDSSTKALEH
jgi:hypothetical protein